MALRPEFSMGHSAFNEFLWASTGVDENGAPLSVLSALVRLGFDPWVEAARLTALPKEAAVAAIATILSRLRRSDAANPDAASPEEVTTAGRLVALLQGCASVGAVPDASGRRFGLNRFSIGLIALAVAGILVGVAIYQSSDNPAGGPPSFSFIAPTS